MVKWFVNLPVEQQLKHGTCIALKAQRVGKSGARKAKWSVKSSNDIGLQYMPLQTRPKFLDAGVEADGLSCTVAEKDDRFETAFQLPLVGGIEYRFTCEKASASITASSAVVPEGQAVVTWRKLFIALYYMDDQQHAALSNAFAKVQDIYRNAFIELELVHGHPKKAARPTERLSMDVNAAKIVLEGDGQWPVYFGGSQGGRNPVTITIVATPSLGELVHQTLNWSFRFSDGVAKDGDGVKLERTERNDLALMLRMPTPRAFPSATERPHFLAARQSLHASEQRLGLPPSPVPSADTPAGFVSRLAWSKGAAPLVPVRDLGSWLRDLRVNVTNDWLTIPALPDAVRRAFETNDIVNLELDVLLVERDSALGSAGGNLLLVACGQSPYDEAQLAKTLAHEIGHACGLTQQTESTWDGQGIAGLPRPNPTWYVGMGGEGPHCNHNARIVAGEYEWSQGDLCIMFHKADSNVGKAFCQECIDSLRRRDFLSVRGAGLGGAITVENARQRWNIYRYF